MLFELLLLNIIQMTMIFSTFIFWLLFHFSRGQNRESRSSVFLCSEIKRKRLLLRLSREVKLFNLLVSIRKIKCNTVFIPFVRYHLFILFLRFKFLLYHYFNAFLFSLTFTYLLFLRFKFLLYHYFNAFLFSLTFTFFLFKSQSL